MIYKSVTITASGGGVGNIKNDDTNWDNCRNDTNGDGTDVSRLYVRSERSGGNYQIYRTLLPIDTSSIPTYAYILSARLRLYCQEKQDNIGSGGVYLFGPTSQPSTTGFTTADYDLVAGSTYGQISLSALVVGTTNDIIINSPNQNITKGSTSKFGLREYYDYAASFPPTNNANYAGFDLGAQLIVTYAVFGTTVPMI